jgi:hypothetical protein
MTLISLLRLLLVVLISASLAACASSPPGYEAIPSIIEEQQVLEEKSTAIWQPTDTITFPTPTAQAVYLKETETENPVVEDGNPCENLGNKYLHDERLGEIKPEYVGSWHAAPFVGSGYEARIVLFPSGNYLYFPSQYRCAINDAACTPSPIEEGTWGIKGDQLYLARNGEIGSVINISIGEVVDSSPDESPYPLKTTIGGTTYWLMSADTNLWNPQTGELCD